MSDRYDPRARRLNPHIGEYIEALDEHWRFMLSSTDYLERKGRLRTLRQIIDQILDEPEWLEPDLRDGAVDAIECWFEPQQFTGEPAPVFLDERPFDTPGKCAGLCFFYADTGKLSYLYEGEPVEPTFGPLLHHGPYVYTLEKRYATITETSMHVMSGNLWRELVPPHEFLSSDLDAPQWFVLCDPRGLGGGKQALRVAIFAAERLAIDAAEELADRIGVRLIVAKTRRKWCTR